MKRFIKIIIFILCLSLGITACNNVNDKEQPKVNVIFNISNLTEDEFKDVGTKELQNVTKEDFKKLTFILEVEHSSKIENRQIVAPSIKDVVISKYKERYWFGESSSQDNRGENFARYNQEIVLYSKGLEEKDISEIFKSTEVKISWTTPNGENKEETFSLADNIEFK